MGSWLAVKTALRLLARRDRLLLGLVVVAQAVLALLDLAGIAILGLVVALAASTASGGAVPPQLSTLLDVAGLEASISPSFVAQLAVLAGLLLIGKSILSFLLTRRAFRFLASRQATISSSLASDLLSQPLLFVQRRSSQETSYALTSGANAATLGILGNGLVIASEAALILVLTLGLMAVDPVVALFTLAYFFLIGLLLQKTLSGWAASLGAQVASAEVKSMASVQEAMRTYREVTVFGRRNLYVERFRTLRIMAARVQADIQVMSQISKYAFEVALIVGAGILVFTMASSGDLASGLAVIAVFMAAASRMMPSLLRVQGAALGIRSASNSAAPTLALARELDGVDNHSALLTESEQGASALLRGLEQGYEGLTASLSVQSVMLIYPGADRPAVSNVSFEVTQGSSVALVGATGSGKSTLADLILGVLEPDEGQVLIGGLAPGDATRQWPGSVTYVPQDIAVVDGTVRDNVALGLTPEMTYDERIWEALERAQLASLLRGSREGLDTLVGEHGVRLSGGQKQRLGLARALYSRPRLLVLDEATSALDAETELAVSKALTALEGTVTTVTIAHRLATVRHCDLVLYLEHGRVAASGTFGEVRAHNEAFDRQARLLGL